MQIQLRNDLPFISATICFQGKEILISNVLIDTGSAASMFSADLMQKIGIQPEANDILHIIRGVGGTEVVYLRRVDFVKVNSRRFKDFEIEVGGMDYGFGIEGILGMDYLVPSGAIINLDSLQLEFA